MQYVGPYQPYTNAIPTLYQRYDASVVPPYFLRISSVMSPTTYGDGMESIGRG